MSRAAAAARAPMRTTPSNKPTPSAERDEILRLLAMMSAAFPSADGSPSYRFDSWSQHGRLAADARYFDGEAWVSQTTQGAPSVAEAERRVLLVLRAIAGSR